jgi:hypothetical protein
MLSSLAINFLLFDCQFSQETHQNLAGSSSTSPVHKESHIDQDIPLQIYPLLKEMGSGWSNMDVPPLLNRNGSASISLIVDVGLDKGDEFFFAVDKGFEVVGIDANPHSF